MRSYEARRPRWRYLVTVPDKCPVHVRCTEVASGITAEAEDERETLARDRARARAEQIKREAGL